MSTDELRICARRVLIAWDGTVLPKRRDEQMFERMEDLRSSLEAQPQPEPVADQLRALAAFETYWNSLADDPDSTPEVIARCRYSAMNA